MQNVSEHASPSITSVAVATGILGLLTGYFIGQGSSIGLFGSKGDKTASGAKKSWPNSYDVNVHVDSSDEELMAQLAGNRQEGGDDDDEGDSLGDGQELKNFDSLQEDVKLIMVVRTDLGMTKGKIAAQCGHATLACYKYLVSHAPSGPLLKRWEWGGQTKIAVQCKSEEEMQLLHAQAVSLGLCARIIHDAGRTQIAAGSATVLGVLGPKSVVDQITGHLKLL